MKNLARACLVLALPLCLLTKVAWADSLLDLVEKHRKSVIYIKVQKAVESTGAVTEQSGTGFIVNAQGFVITAAHVVAGGAGLQVEIRGAMGSREGALEAMEVVFESSNFDVALLRFKNTAISRLPIPLGDPWGVPDAATIFAMGFPGQEEWFHTEGKLAGKGPKGSWNTTLTLNPGMSGGPIFDSSGRIVAMVWGGALGVTGITRVLPINLIAEPLKFAGVSAGGSAITLPPTPSKGLEISYKFEQTQTTAGGVSPSSNTYTKVFPAKVGHQIVDHKFVSKSANHASQFNLQVSPDKKQITMTFVLQSGSIFDQWRGWLDGEILTLQAPD